MIKANQPQAPFFTSGGLLIKTEKLVLILLFFFLPFSWRWVGETGGGRFNEWQTVFFYGTDLLIIILLGLGFRNWKSNGRWKAIFNPPHLWLLFFVGWSALAWLWSENFSLGFFRWLKLLEFSGLYLYFALEVGQLWRFSQILLLFFSSALFQAVIAWGQAFKQSSLGLQKIGESVLRANFNGVAVVPLADGRDFLRSYGLLPHPNVLALWLFIGIFSFYAWYLSRRRSFWFLILIYVPLLWGFFFSFSRAAIGLWLLGLIVRLIWILKNRSKIDFSLDFRRQLKKLFWVSLIAVLLFAAVFWAPVRARMNLTTDEPAVTERLTYNHLALQLSFSRFWRGVGPGQWVENLKQNYPDFPEYFYQPVHNIYLLIAGETGLIGLLAFLLWLGYLVCQYNRQRKKDDLAGFSLLVFVWSILIMGLIDHFLWSIHLGQMSLAIILGVLASRTKAKIKRHYSP